MNIQTIFRRRRSSNLDDAWWRGAVLYQIYPRSFADANGDGVGDLPGITARLGHVADLGVDAVWLSPFFRSPMCDFGYDVSDYTDVDPLFGSLDDFDALVARAHELGLKVLIDQVYSHTSDAHAWFAQSRADRANAKSDWYVWADPKPDGSPPNNWQSVFGGPAWTWDARRGQYYFHNFLASQPQMNAHNPAVQDALVDVARFWLDRGVDGFRLDAISFLMHDPALRDNPPRPADDGGPRTRPFDFQRHDHNQSHAAIPAFLSRLRELARDYDDAFYVAEIDKEHAAREMPEYTRGPDRLHSAYGFTYLYADALTPQLVKDAAAGWPEAAGEGWPAWTFANHDAPRCVSRWAKGRDRKAFADMTLMLLVSLRGTAILYQGEELGLPQADVPYERLQDPEAIANWPATLGRDGARTPIPWDKDAPHAGFSPDSAPEPWLPIDAAHRALAVNAQAVDPDATLHVAKRAIALRKRFEALRTGDTTFHDAPGDLLVFTRGDGADAVLCAFNLGFEPAQWTPPSGWRIADSVNHEGGDTLAPMAAVLFEKA